MRLQIPYVLFKTKTGEYGLDAYFFHRLEKVEHRAVLIRKAESIKPTSKVRELLEISPKSVEQVLKGLALTLYELSGKSFKERGRHIRRWNIYRFLGIPTGYFKNLKRDDELAKRSREALLALSIVEHVLGVRKPGDVERAMIIPIGWGILEVEIVDGKPVDPVYGELYTTDSGFRRALQELVEERKRKL